MQTKAQSALNILGLPAFRLEVLDEVDPVPVGGRTTYKIDVTNQGSLPGDRVEIVATVPAEMKVVNANGPAKARIEGPHVFFLPRPRPATEENFQLLGGGRGRAASAPAARELIAERGGPGWWAAHTGSVPSASFTVTKLRWLAEHEPGNAARVARVMLPHDWLTWRLSAAGAAGRDGRAHRRAGHRPRRRVRHRLLLARPKPLAARGGRGRAGP